ADPRTLRLIHRKRPGERTADISTNKEHQPACRLLRSLFGVNPYRPWSLLLFFLWVIPVRPSSACDRFRGGGLVAGGRDETADRLAVGEVPQPDVPVPAPRGDGLPVRGDSHGIDPVLVALELAEGTAVGLEDLDGLVGTAGDEGLAVGRVA